MTRLQARELTSEAFAPYGRVIGTPERPEDATGPGWRWWAETVILPADGRPFGVGYLDLYPAPPPRFDWAERHMRTIEAVVPVDGACLLYVAPAEHMDEPERIPELERFEVFRIRPGQGVAMERGVWHGAPLALDAPAKAIVLILEHTGRDDVTVVRFEDRPVAVAL